MTAATSLPEKSDRLVGAGLAVAAVLFFSPGLFWGLPNGKAINGAYQILDGRIIYRDFWTMYAPGMFYLTAGVFKFVGQEVVYQGAVAILIRAGIVTASYLLIRRLGLNKLSSAALALVIAAGMWQTSPEILSYHPALFCLLLFLTQMIQYYRAGTGKTLFWGGVWAGLAACFKHDVAAYFVLSTTLGLFLSWALTTRPRPSHWMSPHRAAGYMALGTLVFALPTTAWITATAGADAWQDLFVFPATVFGKIRSEPYAPWIPGLDLFREWLADPLWLNKGRRALSDLAHWILCQLPLFVFLLGVAILLGRRRDIPGPQFASMLTLTAGIPFFWAAAHVQQNTHLFTMAVLSVLLGVVVWSSLADSANRWVRRLLVAAATVYGFGIVVPPMLRATHVAQEWGEHRTLDFAGVRWIRVSKKTYETYEPIARFLRENTSDGEYIYAGLERHDYTEINDPRWYYLSDRLSCCRYSELHMGVTDIEETQAEIIRDIEDHSVRALVLWQFGGPRADTVRQNQLKERRAARVPGIGAVRLDEYIDGHFKPLLASGEHTVYWRKGFPLPETQPHTYAPADRAAIE